MRKVRIVLLSKKKLLFSLLFLVAVLILVNLVQEEAQMTLSNIASGQTVVIDPGHGGVDSGAVFENILEKEITLDTALHIKRYLDEKNIPLTLTRDSDIDLGGELTKGRHKRDLLARREIINKGKIAVSIHVNTIGDIEEEGAVVFYAKGSSEGERLAASILAELNKVQKLNYSKPIPRTNLFLLRTSIPPMVLVELGFLSNSQDRAKLIRSEFRRECAKAIADGVENYLK